MITNYVKVLARRTVYEARVGILNDVGPLYLEEVWFFDDTDVASTNAALDRARAFRDRQPIGTRFQISVWKPIAAAPKIPRVGEQPSGMRRAAA